MATYYIEGIEINNRLMEDLNYDNDRIDINGISNWSNGFGK
jgi:hypothetical protein